MLLNSFKENKCFCDSCKKPFTISLETQAFVDSDVQETFFKCPECNMHYTCYVTNSEIRKLMILQNMHFDAKRKKLLGVKMETLKQKFVDGRKMEVANG